MVQVIGETVAALTRFTSAGSFDPVRIKWRNHTIRIRSVTGRWDRHDGQFKIYHFALVGEGDAFYEITFHTRDMTWRLEKMAVE